MNRKTRFTIEPHPQSGPAGMIDIFTVVVPHALMAIAVWRLLLRDDLDHDPILPDTRRIMVRRKRSQVPEEGSPGA